MGMDAGVTVSFYSNGKLIKQSYINCYKYSKASQTFSVTKFDSIKVKFATEYDSDSQDSEENNNSELDKLMDKTDGV